MIATWCQREAPPERPFSAQERSALQFLYDEWAHPFFVSVQEYGRLLEVRLVASREDVWGASFSWLPIYRRSKEVTRFFFRIC